MQIFVVIKADKEEDKNFFISININSYDKRKTLMEEIVNQINKSGISKFINKGYFNLFYRGKPVYEDKTLEDQGIVNNAVIFLVSERGIDGAGPIDNLKNEESENIGFDMSLIKRKELNINLIYFDSQITNKENYEYYNNFKIDVVGGFYAIDNLNILKNYLDYIKEKNIPFLVISNGASGKDVIHLCLKYTYIKEVIIF